MATAEIPTPHTGGLESDPLVYEALRDLALSTIAEAKEILNAAAPQQKINFIRIMLPRLMATLSSGSEDDLAELRSQVTAMNASVEAALGGGDPVFPHEDTQGDQGG